MKREPSSRAGFLPVVVVWPLFLLWTAVIAQPPPPESDAARTYASATGMLNRGLHELAAAEYRKFLAAHSDHADVPLARYGLGVALYRLKDHAAAEKELRPLAEVMDFQFAAEALLLRGQCLLAEQKAAEASRVLQKLIEDDGPHKHAGDAAALLTETTYRAGDYAATRASCQWLIQRWPQHAARERAEYFDGLAALGLEDFASAITAFDSMRQRYPKGALADHVNLLLAQALHRGGEPERAIKQYQTVIKTPKNETLAEALYGLAILQHSQSRLDEAGKLLDQYLEKFPAHAMAAEARLQRGRIWFDSKQYDQALTALETAANSGAPGDQTAFWIAKCHLRRGDFKAAVATLEAAVKHFPASPLLAEMSYDRAAALRQAGDHEPAAEALARFRQKFPDHRLAPDALYMQATLEHARNNYAKCRIFCAEFEKTYGDHALASAVGFLAAEADLLAGKFADAADGYRKFLDRHPADAQAALARLRLGTTLHRLNRFDEAEPVLRQLATGKKTPEPNRRALLLLGDISFQREQWAESIVLFSDYLSLGTNQPDADDALLKSALAALRLDKPDDAMASLARLLNDHPASVHGVHARFEQGQIWLGKSDFDRAAAAFETIVNDSKDSRFVPFALSHLATIAMQRRQFDAAADLYSKSAHAVTSADASGLALFNQGQALMAAKKHVEAAEVFAAFTKKHPSHERAGEAMAHSALALARHGDHAQALKAIQNIQRAHPRGIDAALTATLHYEKAWCLRESGRSDEAADAYVQLIAECGAQPIAANAMLELADLHTQAGRHAHAEPLLAQMRAVIERGSLDVSAEVKEQAHYRLAVCKFELAKFAEAAELFEGFIQEYPQSDRQASVRVYAAESCFKQQQFSKAAPHYAALIERHASDPACSTAMLRLGECQAAEAHWPQSEKTFAGFMKKYPDHELWFQAQFGVAWAKENQAQYDQAITAYRSLLDRHSGPTAARAQFQIGECLFAKKKYDEAVRELLKVDILYAYPEWSAAALFEAGRCFEELSKFVEARSQFEDVRQRFPDSRWAALASDRLRTLAATITP